MSRDRKSTRLNSSHTVISYAVFCLKKKKQKLNELANESARELLPHSDHNVERQVDCEVHGLRRVGVDVTAVVQRARSFFFNDTATTEIYTLSLHDALPI